MKDKYKSTYAKKNALKKVASAIVKVAKSKPTRSLKFRPTRLFTYNLQLNDQLLTNSANAGVPLVAPPNPILIGNVTNGLFPNYVNMGLAYAFKVSDFTNFPQYASLYDQYKVNKITITMSFLCASATINSQGLTPWVDYSHDNDDAIIPTTDQQVSRLAGSKRRMISDNRSTVYFTYTPKLQIGTESTNPVNIAYGPANQNQWIDCAETGVIYNAYKAYISNFFCPANVSPAVNNAIRIQVKANISFKSPLLLSA